MKNKNIQNPSIVVIDGLSRSGTTLLSSLLHSQRNIACYRGVFPEMLALNLGAWPDGTLSAPSVRTSTKIRIVNDSAANHPFQIARNEMDFYWKTFFGVTMDRIQRENQTDRKSISDWLREFNVAPAKLSDIDQMYVSIAHSLEVDLLGLRWNQGIAVAPLWKRRPNHKWVCCIRNPMDRACSARKIWSKSYESSLNSLKSFANHIEQNYCYIDAIVYYEDVVTAPMKALEAVFYKINHPIKSINITELKHQDGSAYRNEKADLVECHGTHKKGEPFRGFYTNSVNRYQKEMDSVTINMFRKTMEGFSFLRRYC